MFSDYQQPVLGLPTVRLEKNENENGLAFKGFKNSVNGILGENGLDVSKTIKLSRQLSSNVHRNTGQQVVWTCRQLKRDKSYHRRVNLRLTSGTSLTW